MLVSKQTKNESTGKIFKSEFKVDPQQFLDAQDSDNAPLVVDKLICEEEIYFKQGEGHKSSIDLLHEIFGAMVTDIVERVKKENGFASGQNIYKGNSFQEDSYNRRSR